MDTLAQKADQPTGRHEEDEIVRLMGRSRVLHCLPQEEQRGLARRSTLLRFGERDLIFSQGEEGRTVMVLLQGYVKLSSSTAGGREVVLELAGPGSLFGELAVLTGWCRAADAHALSACQLLSIEARLFTRTLARVPEAMFGLLRMFSSRLRTVTEQMTDGVDLPGPQRLAKVLLKLAGLHSHAVADGLQIDLQLSQRELGAMTGLTRESINKHLSGWRDEGVIRISGGCITLVDRAGMERRALESTQEDARSRSCSRGETSPRGLWTRSSAVAAVCPRPVLRLQRPP
jgi:CRP/FNR family cyclic AMP-dependent transcriptional regulator